MVNKKQATHRFICIRQCFDASCKMWEVGNVFEGEEAPMPKHFMKTNPRRKDVVSALRDKLDDMGVGWEREWSLEKLQQMVDNEELKARKLAQQHKNFPTEKKIHNALKGKDAEK